MSDQQPLLSSPYYPQRQGTVSDAAYMGIARARGLQVGNILAFLVAFTVHILDYAGVLGKTEGDVRRSYVHVPGIAAEYAFYGWGFIYAMGACYCVYQALPVARNSEICLQDVGGRLIFVHYFLAAWSILFCLNEQVGCVAVLLPAVCFLVQAYRRVGVGVYVEQNTLADCWLVEVPVSAYFAWTIYLLTVNVMIAADALGWDGTPWHAAGWTALALSLLGLLTIALLYRHVDVVFAVVLAWLLLGVALAQERGDRGEQGEMLFRAALTWTVIIILLASIALAIRLYDWYLRRQERFLPRGAKIRI